MFGVSPTKQAMSIFSLVEEMLDESNNLTEKPCQIEIRPSRLNKRTEQVRTSMESTSPVSRVQQYCYLPHENTEPSTSPKPSSMDQEGNINNFVSNVPGMVVTLGDKVSNYCTAEEWSSMPCQESGTNSSRRKSHHHPNLVSSNSRHRSMAFPHMCALQASKSCMFDHISLPAPPSLVSDVSSKGYLLGQPLIQSPAPMTIRSTNGQSGFMISQMMSSMTPLSENSFHPAMFSVDSTVSNRIAYSESGSIIAVSGDNRSINSIVSTSASRHRPISGGRGKAMPSTPAIIRNHRPVLGCVGEPIYSGFFEHQTQQVVASPHSRPRLYADKMVAFLAAKQAHGDDDVDALVCTCPKSRCLKLYCVCFQRARLCDESVCKCTNCKNTEKHDGPNGARTIAMATISKRRQDAFQKRKKQTGLGCSCKRNKCLKKYCACYSEGTSCDDSKCDCVNCHNATDQLDSFAHSPLSMGSEICPV